ncbi:MAG TPA: LPS export ABC transporter permease LptF [Gammaproteobacteria bacterium]|nr:LPS export ABC transporter permease LptF [Gammaproteobacteria bacterium]
MLLKNYLQKELFKTFIAVLSVLLLIAISHKFVRLIAQAASGDVSPALLLQAIGLQIPEILSILLPLSLYLSILLSFGRLYVDHELPAMFACGFSWQPLVQVCLIFGSWLTIVVGALTLYIVPKLAEIRDILFQQQVGSILVETVAPGRFHAFSDDKFIFYVEKLSNDRKKMQEVFIAEKTPDQPETDKNRRVVIAQTGNIQTDPKTGSLTVILHNGTQFEGTPGQRDYAVVSFDEYGKVIAQKPPTKGIYYHRSMPTNLLLKMTNKSYRAEFLWRISIPVSVLILALLAVALSRVPPRLGRFAKILPAIILYVMYYNFLILSKRWVANEMLPVWLSVWWVHFSMLLLAAFLLLEASGRWYQFKSGLKKPTLFRWV